MRSIAYCSVYCLAACVVGAASAAGSAAPWVADQGDGTFKNPVLFADYSDPDVIRVGDDFYLTSSSFSNVPGLPILHSRDLVNWRIIGHAVERLPERFDTAQLGDGIWAPSLRYHDGWYWIFVGDADRGILMTRAKQPAGPWSPLHLVKAGKGLIDPCPLWDDDGRAYLVHAYAKSRSGKNSIIVAREMSPDGRQLLGDEHLLIDGRDGSEPTVEGPKFYKRNGWYYLFSPAGGVKQGWQIAARSRQPFGPYEIRRVLEQGSTDVNGPHQGGWVELANGESWFLHFQDRGAYGRVVHLNPVRWVDDWPVMGVDYDGNSIGEPVATFRKPNVREPVEIAVPQSSDEFAGSPNLAWQWQANPQAGWSSSVARPGWLRLNAQPRSADLTNAPNQLLQKFPAPAFTATTKLDLGAAGPHVEAGLVVMSLRYAGLLASRDHAGLTLKQVVGAQGKAEQTLATVAGLPDVVWLRVSVDADEKCRFSYGVDGEKFEPLGKSFVASPGRWIGAKVGLVCLGADGYADFDWFRIE
jgi:beta-xylosidase